MTKAKPNNLLPKKLVFLDLETTGGGIGGDKIIEIGMVKIENGKIVETYQKLVNPEIHVPPEIYKFTGITPTELEQAAGFNSMADEVLEFVKGSTLVAHNARFDYGFLKRAFREEGVSFRVKTLCTVKLSRRLFPDQIHHNLDTIISKYNLVCESRHRAYDDALATWQFYKKLTETVGEAKLAEAVAAVMKKAVLPAALPQDLPAKLPESPGVYTFYNKEGMALYIGKSRNIKDRVMSHFTNDYQSPTDAKIAQYATSLDHILTAGDLSACLLEAKMVKEQQPMYNKQLRNSKTMVGLRQTESPQGQMGMEIFTTGEIFSNELDGLLGLFRSKQEVLEKLVEMTREYGLCDRLMGLQRGRGACFGYGIGRCKGICVGAENLGIYNARCSEAVSGMGIRPWPFKGKVIIREKDPESRKRTNHVVDKWCHLGTVGEDGEWNELSRGPYRFDWDTYKIIRRWLMNPGNLKMVKVL